jgi:plasmid stabilization system protein ParE
VKQARFIAEARQEFLIEVASQRSAPRTGISIYHHSRRSNRQSAGFPACRLTLSIKHASYIHRRKRGTRELIINRTPCVAVYRIKGEQVELLRLLHGAQQWP